MNGIDKLFSPRAAVICGSMGEGKLGAVLMARVKGGGFSRVYAVNPKAQGYMGEQGYSSVCDVPDTVDMAVIVSPAKAVNAVLEDCGRAGVGAAVIISSGFSEAGEHALQAELMATAKKYNIRCVGPNCAGLINTKNKLCPTLEAQPHTGRTAIISQSGAVGGLLMAGDGIAVSKFVSYGNGADLSETELLKYMADDADTDVIAMYVENIRHGREFMAALSDAVRKKPVVIIKSGRTQSGGRAALSHTGSMAGEDAAYTAAFKKCGAIRAYSVEEMRNTVRGLSAGRRLAGRRVAVITNSGGPGVMCADRLEETGLCCDAPSRGLLNTLRAELPPFAGLANPIDLTAQGDETTYAAALRAALSCYDAAIVIYVGTPYLHALPIARAIAGVRTDKPVFASFDVGADMDAANAALKEAGIPRFESGEKAAEALSKLIGLPQGRLALPDARGGRLNVSHVSELDAMALLNSIGIPTPGHRLARTADEAVSAARELGYPVCMKVISESIVHKSDVGGVRLNINSDADAVSAFAALSLLNGFAGAAVYPMLKPGVEVIMGLVRDRQFGPAVMFGTGGIYAEALLDTALSIAPINKPEALSMIKSVKAYKLLEGARGKAPCDVDALADALVKLSELMDSYEDIQEVDINPVFVYESGCVAADARIIMEAKA